MHILCLCSCFHSAYIITDFMGIRNENFMKVAAVGTWMGDFVTAWMVRNIITFLKERNMFVAFKRKRRGEERKLDFSKCFNPEK